MGDRMISDSREIWKKVIDFGTKKVYYLNTITEEKFEKAPFGVNEATLEEIVIESNEDEGPGQWEEVAEEDRVILPNPGRPESYYEPSPTFVRRNHVGMEEIERLVQNGADEAEKLESLIRVATAGIEIRRVVQVRPPEDPQPPAKVEFKRRAIKK